MQGPLAQHKRSSVLGAVPSCTQFTAVCVCVEEGCLFFSAVGKLVKLDEISFLDLFYCFF